MKTNNMLPEAPFITVYALFLLAVIALLPSMAILYLNYFQSDALFFEDHNFHIIAICFAVFISMFVCYVTWRCYLDSGEKFLFWLTLGFLGFIFIYAPHGFLTLFADQSPWLFLLYGPASRIVMSSCFLIAMYQFGKPDDLPEQRLRRKHWQYAILIFIIVDVLVAAWALSSWNAVPWIRLSMEYAAIGMYTICIFWMILQRINNPLMIIYAIALAWFAQSSLSFTYGLMWSHQWWLAHIIFAGGFFILSFGVVQAYASTRSFSKVYSQAELLEELREEKARTEKALVNLQDANDQLEKLAATDPLTGVANRREFLSRMEQEIARSLRSKSALSLLLADIDHFKLVNDNYSHQAGDIVLKQFAEQAQSMLRPGDILGRIGGEEFTILLTNTDLTQAKVTANRLREQIEKQVIEIDGDNINITVSIGVVEYHPDNTVNELLHRADLLMYQAKERGRNRIEYEVLAD